MSYNKLTEENLIAMFGSECIDHRLQAASIVMGREIRLGEKNILEHLMGTMEPEERLANLLIEKSSEMGIENETPTVRRESISG